MLETILKNIFIIIEGTFYSIISFIKKNVIVSVFCIILSVFIIISIFVQKDSNKSKIISVVPNVQFAGMGVLLNKKFILTTDYLVNNICFHKDATDNLIFALYKGQYYLVKQVLSSKESNLSLLKITDFKFKEETIINYALLSDRNNINLKETVYFYKNINEPYNSIFKKTKVKTIYDYTFLLNNKRKYLESEGSPVLDNSLNLIGIVSENSKGNNLLVLNINLINTFLKKAPIDYFINRNNKINLTQIHNYAKDITVQIVCNPDIPNIKLQTN